MHPAIQAAGTLARERKPHAGEWCNIPRSITLPERTPGAGTVPTFSAPALLAFAPVLNRSYTGQNFRRTGQGICRIGQNLAHTGQKLSATGQNLSPTGQKKYRTGLKLSGTGLKQLD